MHYPAVPSDARRRGAAGSARKDARTGSIFRGRFFYHPRIYGERANVTCAFIFGPLLTHTGSDSPNTKHTLEHGVKHILKDKISSAVSLCLFRYALPLAAFVVDAALLVGSMMFFVSYEFICNVHDAYTTIAA